MIKHLRYFLSPFILLVAIFAILKGNYYPIIFIIIFDVLIEVGDSFLKQDDKPFNNPVPSILNLSLYLNFPLLFIFLSLTLSVLIDYNAIWYINLWNYIGINLI